MPVIGDTVRLKAVFRDFDGALVDPDTVVVQIYDDDQAALGASVTLGSDAKISTGTYIYDYTIPSGYTKLYYEFTGTSNGKPSIARAKMTITWLS